MTQQSEIEEIARALETQLESDGLRLAKDVAAPPDVRLVGVRDGGGAISLNNLALAAYEVMARSDGEVSRRAVRDKWTEWKAGEISADDALNTIFDLVVCPPLPDPPSSIRELPHD